DGGELAVTGMQEAAAGARGLPEDVAREPHPDQVSLGHRGRRRQAAAPGPLKEARAPASSASPSSGRSNNSSTPGAPASARSGEGRGAATRTGVPAARNDLAMDSKMVDRPDLAGPATIKQGAPEARS